MSTHVVSEEKSPQKIVSIIGLWAEREISALRLKNNTKLTVHIGLKCHFNVCSECKLLYNVNNYTEIFVLNSSYDYQLHSILISHSFNVVA
jgi:hypothetical protein